MRGIRERTWKRGHGRRDMGITRGPERKEDMINMRKGESEIKKGYSCWQERGKVLIEGKQVI